MFYLQYKDLNDYELLYMVRDGDDEYLDIILKKYRPIILGSIKKWVKYAKSVNLDIDDLEQEINCAVVDAIRKYDDTLGVSFYSYLTVVVKNTIFRVVKNHTTFKHALLNNAVSLTSCLAETDGLCLEEKITDNFGGLDNYLMKVYQNFKIFSFCYELPVLDGSVYELYFNGYSASSIATLLSLNIYQVNYSIRKIKNKLKKYILQEEDFVL